MDDFYVYLISRPDGRPCYVGKGRGVRWKFHGRAKGKFASNPHLAAIYRQGGGKLPISKLRENLSEEEAHTFEIETIRLIGREPNGPLVNLTDGGEGLSGYKPIRETVDRVNAQNRGRTPWNKGLPWSAEVKAKMSAAKLGHKQTPEHIEARIGPIRGKRPAEWGRKISAAKMGHAVSEETRRKIGEGNRLRRREKLEKSK